jgi:hypothetical protein
VWCYECDQEVARLICLILPLLLCLVFGAHACSPVVRAV